jgi:RIO-like serine/threonine protein kinase
MTFKKTASSLLEIELQRVASTHGFTPKVLSENGLEFEMEKIDAPCLADVYGDDPNEIPFEIWDQIIHILSVLYEHEGIEYIDITPYNFIELNGKVWIIDFGHAHYTLSPNTPDNWFLRDFLANGICIWNPDFK